ncbi:zeta toxin family protein [Streptomyces gamaensis]|uniref:UDP-N-acetylglucosamine kinase n=1 Tax=Streptomyces gamaensis TaxID=1763542 RepID=A0ABW0Z9S1_9ACTN
MSDPEAARYLLPEAENRRIFLERIVPQQFAGRVPQETPTVVVLLGQPGAGKTRVGHMLAGVLNQRGGFIDVDSDLYKPYHPAYARLMQQDDKLMAAYTRADGRRWMAQAHEYVREARVNAVIQETSQDGEAVAATMRAYRESGFRVEVVAMGVSQALSNQGIVHRYHEQVKERGSGRLTVQANADQSYLGILDLARLVDEQALADHVAVFRRGEGKPRYINGLGRDGRWQQRPALADSIAAERARPWTAVESADFLQVQGKLRQEMGPEWSAQLDRIDRLAGPNLDPLTTWSDGDLARALQQTRVSLEAAERLAATAEQHTAALDAASAEQLRRLAGQGASAAVVERAGQAAREDREFAAGQAAEARSGADGLRDRVAGISAEVQRREGLSPQRRRAEDAGRRHVTVKAAQVPQQQVPAPPPTAQTARRPAPQHPPQGRGRTL